MFCFFLISAIFLLNNNVISCLPAFSVLITEIDIILNLLYYSDICNVDFQAVLDA